MISADRKLDRTRPPAPAPGAPDPAPEAPDPADDEAAGAGRLPPSSDNCTINFSLKN